MSISRSWPSPFPDDGGFPHRGELEIADGMALALSDVPGQVFLAMNGPPEEVDPAAVFAIASSLRKACEVRLKNDSELNLARAYNGWDQFTRELMRVAGMFEEWACMHVAFDHMEDT